MRTLTFKGCEVRFWDGYLETVYPDGQVCPALFVDDSASRALAASLGYTHPNEMHAEHDVAHTFLAEEVDGLPYSPVLFRVAAGIEISPERRAHEEGRTLAFQKYLNTGEASDLLQDIQNLEALGEQFKAKCRSDACA